jgi:hypothetical protein
MDPEKEFGMSLVSMSVWKLDVLEDVIIQCYGLDLIYKLSVDTFDKSGTVSTLDILLLKRSFGH